MLSNVKEENTSNEQNIRSYQAFCRKNYVFLTMQPCKKVHCYVHTIFGNDNTLSVHVLDHRKQAVSSQFSKLPALILKWKMNVAFLQVICIPLPE